MTTDLEHSLEVSRAALRALTAANASMLERLERAEERAEEAERAVAALKALLDDDEPHPADGDMSTPDDWAEHEAWAKRREVALASIPIGSGWLSPAEAAEKDARIEALSKALSHLRHANHGFLGRFCDGCRSIDIALAAPAADHPTEASDG